MVKSTCIYEWSFLYFSDSLDMLGLLAIDVDIKIYEVFSGCYIHNLCIELYERIQPPCYCTELLVHGQDYSHFFQQ